MNGTWKGVGKLQRGWEMFRVPGSGFRELGSGFWSESGSGSGSGSGKCGR